jgi:hypothetical protein
MWEFASVSSNLTATPISPVTSTLTGYRSVIGWIVNAASIDSTNAPLGDQTGRYEIKIKEIYIIPALTRRTRDDIGEYY